MEVSLTAFILGLLGLPAIGILIAEAFKYFTGKGQNKALTEGQKIKNAKENDELLEQLQVKAEKIIKEKFEKSEEINQLKSSLHVEVNTRKIQGESLLQLAQDVGASREAEKICRENMDKLKNEFESYKQIRKVQDDTHNKKVIELLENICERVKV